MAVGAVLWLASCGGSPATETPDPAPLDPEVPIVDPPLPPEDPSPEDPDPAVDGSGAFVWVAADENAMSRVEASDVDAAGNVYVLTQTFTDGTGASDIAEATGELRKYGADGTERFRKTISGEQWESASIAVSDAGDVFVQVNGHPVFDADGALEGNVLARLTTEGVPVWKKRLTPAEPVVENTRIADVSFDGRVALLDLHDSEQTPTVTVLDANGTPVWEKQLANAEAAAFDLGTDLIVGVGGKVEGGLKRFDATGAAVWTEGAGMFALDTSDPDTFVRIENIAVTRVGTIVANADYIGKLSWGGKALAVPSQDGSGGPLTHNNVVFAAEPSGSARFATIIEDKLIVDMAVDRGGRAFVTTPDVLMKFDLEGALVWTREGPGFPQDLRATVDHGVVVVGQYFDPTDFGSGLRTPDTEGGSALVIHYGP